MNCKKVKRLLIPFIEAEVSKKMKERIKTHLDKCVKCRQEKELFVKSWQALDDYTAPELKEDFTVSLMGKIHAQQAKIIKITYKLPQFIFGRLAPVLAVLLVGVLTFTVFKEKIIEINKQIIAKIAPDRRTVYPITDEEIVKNLDILENLELLENLQLLSDLELVENTDEKKS